MQDDKVCNNLLNLAKIITGNYCKQHEQLRRMFNLIIIYYPWMGMNISMSIRELNGQIVIVH